MAEMVDVHASKECEVLIRADNGLVWINVDGVCRLRVKCDPDTVILFNKQENKRNPGDD